MATAKQFEDLGVWQDARELVKEIYSASKQRAFYRDFGLRDQIRRAATSTMSNIAEGFERGSRKEFIQFLSIAKGSNGEVRSQLYVAIGSGIRDGERIQRPSCFSRFSFQAHRSLHPLPGNLSEQHPRSQTDETLSKENLQPSTFNLQLFMHS